MRTTAVHPHTQQCTAHLLYNVTSTDASRTREQAGAAGLSSPPLHSSIPPKSYGNNMETPHGVGGVSL